jgi:hypothetical protein
MGRQGEDDPAAVIVGRPMSDEFQGERAGGCLVCTHIVAIRVHCWLRRDPAMGTEGTLYRASTEMPGQKPSDRCERFFRRVDDYLPCLPDGKARRLFLDRQIAGWEHRTRASLRLRAAPSRCSTPPTRRRLRTSYSP